MTRVMFAAVLLGVTCAYAKREFIPTFKHFVSPEHTWRFRSNVLVHRMPKPDIAASLATYVKSVSEAAIKDHNRFTIALSGGSMPKVLGEGLAKENLDWSKWFVYFADERAVPLTDKDSNFLACKEHFFSKVGIPKDQIFAINEIGEGLPDTAALATDYEKRMLKSFGMSFTPRLDLVMLGMGPDGHTASLFPGHPLLEASSMSTISPITDSPKPPPNRITFSLHAINAARQICFVATGGSKADVMKPILEGTSDLPAARVKARKDAELHWFVDEDATKSIDFNGKNRADFLGLGLTNGKLELR